MNTSTHFVARSANSKLGPMSATYRERSSCPVSCPMLTKGCYAAGRIEAIATHLGTEDPSAWVDRAIAEIPENGVHRNLVVGDLVTRGADGVERLDRGFADGIDALAAERPDVLQITYSHALGNPEVADWARSTSVVVNASCSTLEEVETWSQRGFLPVVVLTDHADPLVGQVIDGRRVIICPAETNDVQCRECRLCARGDREGWKRPVIGFPAHSSGKRAAAATTGRVLEEWANAQ